MPPYVNCAFFVVNGVRQLEDPEGLAGGRGHSGPKSAPEAPNEEDPN